MSVSQQVVIWNSFILVSCSALQLTQIGSTIVATALNSNGRLTAGVFTEIEKASRHLKGGAKKVSFRQACTTVPCLLQLLSLASLPSHDHAVLCNK